MKLLTAGLLLGLVACRGDHSHGEHSHEGGGHTHGHGEEADDPRPGNAVTRYQDGLELFMEYPSFVVGQDSPLVAHFTDTRDPEAFRVITKGAVTASLRHADGTEERFVADKLLRDGIFKPAVKPTRAGEATLTLELTGEQAAGRVDVGPVVVYPTVEAAVAAEPEEAAGEPTVPYLKEQQWKTVYATAPAEVRQLRTGVRANAELKPVAGQFAELAASVQGRVVVGQKVPHVGQQVTQGELLLSLLPLAGAGDRDRAGLELEASRAKSELGLATRAVTRAEELLAARAIPEKQLDEAKVARDVAAARLEAAERQLALYRTSQTGSGAAAGAAFELRSPITGVISYADVTPGAVVAPGTRLLAVVNPARLWLEARVYEVDAARVTKTSGASFTVSGIDKRFDVDTTSGRVVAVGSTIDRVTRTVPVIFELPNPDGILKPGMYAKATVYGAEASEATAIPEQAVVDDSGVPLVYVMEGGESFFKRRVELGARDGGFVEVKKGVSLGERVVSRGAFEIKLATSSGGIPAHGHAH